MSLIQGIRTHLNAASITRICARQAHQRGPSGGPPSHGEKIWIFDNLHTNQIIYSFSDTIDSNKGMRQLTFHGKKTKPAKLRKDYWRPLAMVQFAQGHGTVGRSVFQKLRELRKLHEVNWGDELLVNRRQRGWMLMDQRANAIADLAVVLAGRGLGNLILVDNRKPLKPHLPRQITGAMYKARVLWADMDDKNYARAWSGNVIHSQLPTIIQALTETTEPLVPPEVADPKPSEKDADGDETTDAQVITAKTPEESSATGELHELDEPEIEGQPEGQPAGGGAELANKKKSQTHHLSRSPDSMGKDLAVKKSTETEESAKVEATTEEQSPTTDELQELWYPKDAIRHAKAAIEAKAIIEAKALT